MIKIGLIVNPVAGMGGSVGLKGTDGEAYKRALELGARPVTPVRTEELLAQIQKKTRFRFLVAPGNMGADYCDDSVSVVGTVSLPTSSEDTRSIARELQHKGIELLVFVGGDGTARDIVEAVGLDIPVVAVPSGVKVFSAVFASSVRAAAHMINAFIDGTGLCEREVLDIDEDAFRDNRLASRLYGYLVVPEVEGFLQGGKECSSSAPSSQKSKSEIAKYITESMARGILYFLGPGTTVKAITDLLGVSKTLLGVDAAYESKLVGTDLNEKRILELLDRFTTRRLITTPIGGNGDIFGRGNKQLTPKVLKKIGLENIVIIGTTDKMNKLDALRVDTGDYTLDKELSGYIEVIVGYKETIKMEVLC